MARSIIPPSNAHGNPLVASNTDYWKGHKYKTPRPELQMFAPYPRIVVMHVAIIFGAMLIQTLGLPAMVAVLLIVIKTALELVCLGFTK